MRELTTEEQLAVDEYVRVNKLYDAASDSLEDIFLRGVIEILEGGDIDGAWEYMRKMPESVAKMYVADQIRLTRGDYD
jgi:hypothetical protein